MTTVTRKPGESDAAFRARAFEINRDALDVDAMIDPIRRLVELSRTASPMPAPRPVRRVRLRWHALAILAVVMTVSVGVWFLS